jgi:hypothetical protein
MNETSRSFPLRTLMVCLTIWLIATEILVFDQVKFNARAELLDQAARALRGPEVVVPREPSSNLPGIAKWSSYDGKIATNYEFPLTEREAPPMSRAIEAIPQHTAQPPNRRSHVSMTNIFAPWQSGLETLSGCRQWRLRLELEPSRSRVITVLNP